VKIQPQWVVAPEKQTNNIPEIKFAYCISLHNTEREKGFAGPGSVDGTVNKNVKLSLYTP
jgi:hypothetical protein